MKIVLASNNKNKIKEFKQILGDFEFLTLNDIGFLDDIEETGTTFFENAKIKAQTVQNYLHGKKLSLPVLSDDSGLCVNSLNGEPGVYSARYSGEHGNNENNRQKLLKSLQGKEDRSAYFECVLVLMYPNGEIISAQGKTSGHITTEYHGSTEFCYDCIFYSDDLKKTFGEASFEEKNSVSHRSRAIKNLLSAINEEKKQG